MPLKAADRRALLALGLAGGGSAGLRAQPAASAPAGQAVLALRYGGDAAFAPFESLDAQGRPRGFLIDLLAELGPVTGIAFELRLEPWARTEAAFRRGERDVVAMVDTAERRTWALFTRGMATPALGVYRRPERPAVTALHDLAELRLAVTLGEAMRDTLASLPMLKGPVLRLPDARAALQAVQQGEADVALLPRAYADPLLAGGAWPGLLGDHLSLGLQSYALAVAPERTDLRDRLQRGLDALEASGRLEQLRVRWLSSHRDVAERGQLTSRLAEQRGWTLTAAGTGIAAAGLLGCGLWWRGRRIAQERQRRLLAEAELHRTEALLDQAFTRHPDAMLLVERSSRRIRDANAALEAMLGMPAGALVGQALDDLGRHLDPQALARLAEALAAEGSLQATPLALRRADGALRQCLVSADTLSIDGAPHAFALLRDVTAQLEQDAQLRAAYDALQQQLSDAQQALQAAHAGRHQAEDRLQGFTRAVAHDLKTPLNAVQGFAGLLKQRLQAGKLDEARGYTAHIERAAQRMNAMIQALTRLAQVSAQPLLRRPVDMRRQAEDTVALLQAAQIGSRCTVRIDDLPEARADADLAAQVWQNLLGNALKYSAQAAEPQVRVDSLRDGRGTWYRITDNGAGFDMARAGELFLPFRRLHAGEQFEGSGLGLSLVRRIIDHHGGDITLRSAPGVGTVVQFTLDPAPGA